MAESLMNLAGGLLTGFTGAKNKAREMALNEEYKKILIDENKLKGQLNEAQILKLSKESDLLGWGMGGPIPAWAKGSNIEDEAPQPKAQPFAQYQPMGAAPIPQVPPQAAAPQGLPQIMAGMQNPFNPTGGQAPPLTGGINIPGDPANNISVRQNNPFNLKYVGQAEATGPGTRGFAVFPTPEAGVQAGIKQIQLDQSRGLTLSQFAHKYAPPFENDTNNWIKNVASMTGATPDTPIAQIPTPNLAKAVAKVESSATIGGGLGTPQQAIPQQAPAQAPQTAARGGLTREKFLEGYMKKNFGVEPNEVKDVRYGDHTLIIDKKKGTPLFMIAGQGKTEMVDTTLPDGSIIKRPVVIPPSPLPGGIPVINMAGGGGQGGLMAGPGMQVGPPKYEYKETVTAPGGGKALRAVPQAQPGAPDIQTESPGIKIGDVGKTNQLMHAESKLSEVNDLLFTEGKLDKSLIWAASVPGGGVMKGSTLYSKMYQVIDAALRLETGAQATPGEIEVKMLEFWPKTRDLLDEKVIREKNRDLNEYVSRVVKLHDPTGELRKMGGGPGVTLQVPKGLTNQKPKTWEELKKGLVK